jgi:hypothetical protein
MASLAAILSSDLAPVARPWLGDDAPIVVRDGVHVTADATLYDRQTLASALLAAGQPVSSDATSAEQIKSLIHI